VGYADAFNEDHVGPLTEVIDDLARELNVVIVVPTGNAGVHFDGRMPSGFHILDDKPKHFFDEGHRLSEPGPAALALTVGAVALSEAPAELPGRIGWRVTSSAGEISSFSRSGPGLGTSAKRLNKPDMVHYGGNVVIDDLGQARLSDPGAGIVTTSYRGGSGRIFASVNGTSYAVPAVARIAADVLDAYPDASANLVRALVASSARPPEPALAHTEAHKRGMLYGLGLPSRKRAISSTRRRVTLTYDGSLPNDTVQIHPLALPEIFRRGSGGERTISVALAFDPPVRRQRREYVAASMKVDVFRDIDSEDLREMLARQLRDDSRELITDRRRLDLGPGSNSFSNSTLQVRHWKARNSFVNDDEVFYVAVTHKAQTWARNNPNYESQSYALTVTLEDRALTQANLYQLLTQQVELPATVRVQA
jgi:hypothetical protein